MKLRPLTNDEIFTILDGGDRSAALNAVVEYAASCAIAAMKDAAELIRTKSVETYGCDDIVEHEEAALWLLEAVRAERSDE